MNVIRETELGQELEQWVDERGELAAILAARSDDAPLLRFVDPCGDTVFNQLQIPTLITDLKTLLDTISNQRHKEIVSQVIQFIDRARNQVHTYVRFVGE